MEFVARLLEHILQSGHLKDLPIRSELAPSQPMLSRGKHKTRLGDRGLFMHDVGLTRLTKRERTVNSVLPPEPRLSRARQGLWRGSGTPRRADLALPTGAE